MDAESGTWAVGDGFRVDLATSGMVAVTKTMVEIGHTGEVEEGRETTAVVLLETESNVLIGRGQTSDRFSITAGGDRVEIDNTPRTAENEKFTLKLT